MSKTPYRSPVGWILLAFAWAAVLFLAEWNIVRADADDSPGDITKTPVVFTGGHETLGVDHGRPVILIAAALGVKPEIFREAFTHVHPAGPGSGGPTDAEARANKAALMKALAKYGVTDQRLNAVSNYYRYPPGRGHIWKNRPASANALVKNGKIVGYEILDAGAGYTTPPTLSVPGLPDTAANVQLTFGKDMPTNGAVASITIPQKDGDNSPDQN